LIPVMEFENLGFSIQLSRLDKQSRLSDKEEGKWLVWAMDENKWSTIKHFNQLKDAESFYWEVLRRELSSLRETNDVNFSIGQCGMITVTGKQRVLT